MLSVLNSSVNFGHTQSKTKNDSLQELKSKQSLNQKEKFGATATVLLGYTVGHKAINQFAKGKSFGWNSAINKSIKSVIEKVPDKFGLSFAKDALGKFAKTSGRQKMQGALAVGAGLTLLSVVNHFSKKNGELKAQINEMD